MPVEDAGEREVKWRDGSLQLLSLWGDTEIAQEIRFARSLQMWYARGRENRGLGPFGSVPAPRQAFTHAAGTPDTH
jgi:hypothetical protein